MLTPWDLVKTNVWKHKVMAQHAQHHALNANLLAGNEIGRVGGSTGLCAIEMFLPV